MKYVCYICTLVSVLQPAATPHLYSFRKVKYGLASCSVALKEFQFGERADFPRPGTDTHESTPLSVIRTTLRQIQ
jgi:hypothetical protein